MRGNRYSHLNPQQAALLDHFQYLIGNTDYSLVACNDPEDCCHNAKLLKGPDQLIPIIYDFDTTGFVNPTYAQVNPNVKISNVRQRAYRGYCYAEQHLQKARQTLIDNKDALLTLVQNDAILPDRDKKRALKYLEDGYRTFESDRQYRNRIIRECRS